MKPRPSFVLPKPARTTPLRNVATVGRFDDAPATADGTDARGRPLRSTKDVIEHAIRVAQEVVDQQIGSGERILRHLRRAPVAKRRVGPLEGKSAASLTQRTIEITNEIGVLAVEALETLAESKTVLDVLSKGLGLKSTSADRCEPPTSGPGQAQARLVDVFVSSRKPARVEARLFEPGVAEPQITGLYRPDAPPIRDIVWSVESRSFRVVIPDDQPDGPYHGVILGRDGTPMGTMSATVSTA